MTAASLALVGCGSGGNGGSSGGSDGAIISANSTEPQKPLITYDTTEVGGGRILKQIYAGLVYYDADGAIQNEVASSIDSDDATLWTIKLNDGWTFTNGEAVTAKSFVDTWTHAATDSAGAYWFSNIEGVSEDGSTTPTGLTVVDDLTFTVQLVKPESDYPLRLGYDAYAPFPSVAFDDIAAYGENPIGNGPYMLDGEGAWRHDEGITLVTNPDYKGGRVPQNDGIDIRFYNTLESAYADVQGGNLDVLDQIPDTAFGTYASEFAGRNVNQPAAIFQSFNMGFYVAGFGQDEEGALRRQALSMAVNRDEITETIFQGTRTPATDFTSPVIAGYTDKLEGADLLKYNPEKAKELWAQADAIKPYSGATLTIAYNSDGPHQAWVDAVCNSIKNTLGIEAEGQPYPTFAAALDDREHQKLTGGTRAGWQGDYPSQANFLSPLYSTGGSSNYEGYSSAAFDQKLADAASASSVEEATQLYHEAQEILLKDMASIPLWYQNAVGVWSESVDNVAFGWDSVPLYYQITKA
ncbi:ABC transporter substrate-binding protein [Brooklawnia sp.]|uniref:peptide ABC transporter substrate-binding protein n=1 Tax=Brooklawnia sp. TaxID=2699740 RepID=UPI00311E467A